MAGRPVLWSAGPNAQVWSRPEAQPGDHRKTGLKGTGKSRSAGIMEDRALQDAI